MAKSGKIIGIDLGTTNSVVAVMEGGKPVVIPNPDGARTTPSVVAFRDAERLVGVHAKRQAVTNSERTIYSIKRFMGRRHAEVAREEKMVPYKIVGKPDDLVKVRIDDKDYTPPEISAMILQYLKAYAEDYLGGEVTEAVITVPAYFNDSQRQATKDAGRIAGLEVRRIINEPTAGALAYGLQTKKNQKIAVYDLGGGTFDVSILDVGEGVFEVKATNGDTHLGGDDFDEVLVNFLADEFKKDQGVDLRLDQMALHRLKEAAEKAKCELSSSLQTEINLSFITAVNGVPKHLVQRLTRAQFEGLVAHLVERTRKPCIQAMEDSKLRPSEIDEVILVGGSTRIPAVQKLVEQLFGRQPNRSVNPDEAVAIGAAVQGGILSGEEGLKDLLLLDVTPLSLGIETLGSVCTVLIPRNTTIPAHKAETFSTAADNQPAVDVHVLQGERPMAKDNRTLGRFQLTGIPPAQRGVPQIEVAFDIDANGILNVSARDKGTGKEQSIRIQSSSGLSESEIERMRREAEENVEDDKRVKELAELRNEADTLAWQAERHLKEHADKLTDAQKKPVESAIERLRQVKDGDDPAALRSAKDALEQAAHQLAQTIYQQAPGAADGAADAGPSGTTQEGGPRDGVIDAEFEVKN